MPDSDRKRFLKELIKQFNPGLLNNDIQDVGCGAGLTLPLAESIADELKQSGLIKTVEGLGNMIAPTKEGREAAEDPDWQ